MGCDIHCYIEHRDRNAHEGRPARYWSFGKRINPGRDYAMFGTLAGVRGDGPAVVEPRGFPDDAGSYSQDDAWLRIDYRRAVGGIQGDDGDRTVTPDRAMEYAKYAAAGPYRGEAGTYFNPTDPKAPAYVWHPDWHTPSWLTLDEIEAAFAAREAAHPDYAPDPEWYAVRAAMRELESRSRSTRLVFWFDN